LNSTFIFKYILINYILLNTKNIIQHKSYYNALFHLKIFIDKMQIFLSYASILTLNILRLKKVNFYVKSML